MIIILILIALVVLSAGLIVLFTMLGKHKEYWWETEKSATRIGRNISIGVLVTAGFVLFGCGFGCLLNNMPIMNNRVEAECSNAIASINETYKVLLNTDDSLDKYTAIQQYNNDVKEYKTMIQKAHYTLNNPWISWFENQTYLKFSVDAVSYYTVDN